MIFLFSFTTRLLVKRDVQTGPDIFQPDCKIQISNIFRFISFNIDFLNKNFELITHYPSGIKVITDSIYFSILGTYTNSWVSSLRTPIDIYIWF